MNRPDPGFSGVEIAVVGMAGRFPGASDVDALWRNVLTGVESVRSLGEQELLARGVSAAALADPAYVRKGIVLDDIDCFDAAFFGYSPREAERIDPQHRLLLETAWQALEHAGYGASDEKLLTGIYAGSGPSLYLHRHLMPQVDLEDGDIASMLGLLNGSDLDSLVTRIAYKLDLRGPAIAVQTACSTSLAAVHLACRGLLNHEADLALAGGVWINLMQGRGYRYQPGAILSPDGHCRAFDSQAGGTAIGSGAALVVLKRLADAQADGDTIHAVIRGSALNNDGANKVGYTAPSIEGQAAAIAAAQAMAEVAPESIGYVEAHGTATALGDPIEIAALTQAFGGQGQRQQRCAIGSVKTNIGHLDAAAGVTGLIKAVQALKHGVLPPSLNFHQANAQIDFAASPFYVNTEVRPWPADGTPRRAGVSSFGMGGTNVHVVLEQAPVADVSAATATASDGKPEAGPQPRLLLLSARSDEALQQACEALARHLEAQPAVRLDDVAYTLRRGRRQFARRVAVLARGHGDAIQALRGADAGQRWQGGLPTGRVSVVFMFPGQGAQYPNMGRAAYEQHEVVRQTVDRCCALLQAQLGLDLRDLLFPAIGDEDAAAQRLAQTALTQPALFVLEYALAQWWLAQGVRPDAMLGHSIGEYVAATLAGVFSLEDALKVVAARGRLLQATKPGAMLAVNLPESQLQALALPGCDLAAVNGPDLCVLAGATDAIEQAQRQLSAQGAVCRRLHVSHAFHSASVEPMLAEFERLLSSVALSAPRIAFVSNVTGDWITAQQARSAAYWVQHVRATVRFADGLSLLAAEPQRLLLEVGPGATLAGLACRHPQTAAMTALASQHHAHQSGQTGHDEDALPACLAQLFVAGVDITQAPALECGNCRRVPLPTYPFARERHWIDPQPDTLRPLASVGASDPAGWLHVPAWRRSRVSTQASNAPAVVLVLGDTGPSGNTLADALCASLRQLGHTVVLAQRGPGFARLGPGSFSVRQDQRSDFIELLDCLATEIGPVREVFHLWNVDTDASPLQQEQEQILASSLLSPLALVQALGAQDAHPLALTVVASQLETVSGHEQVNPFKASLHGPCRVAPLEYPHIRCKVIDVVAPVTARDHARVARQLSAELGLRDQQALIAYRGSHRWTRHYVAAGSLAGQVAGLRHQGVYLITGGLGGVGLALARHLAQQWQARLVLLGRSVTADKLAAVAELEALGAQVLVRQADVSDAVQVQDALADTVKRFGGLDGVIHAAGLAGGGVIAQRQPDAIARVFAAKVNGACHVLAAVVPHAPDFVLLCSSMSAITGDFGQVDYCAANCVLDALAIEASRVHWQDTTVLSVNWDVWRGTGMARDQRLPEGVGIAPEQAGRLLERLLGATGCAQVAVSSVSIAEQMVRAAQGPLSGQLLPEVPQLTQSSQSRRLRARPALASEYLAPSDELEQGLEELWTEFLGISPIGAEDNLFELGGDSLLAIQLLTKVRRAYGVDIHPARFFQDPTVRTLALLVEERLIEEVEREGSEADTPHQS